MADDVVGEVALEGEPEPERGRIERVARAPEPPGLLHFDQLRLDAWNQGLLLPHRNVDREDDRVELRFVPYLSDRVR